MESDPVAMNVNKVQAWFTEHVSLDGEPYTLDKDQAAAVLDRHKNTLVTARAGSGKTRVIVAKVAYLVAIEQISLREIAIFMFNRTAAAEVNERIGRVAVDGQALPAISRSNEVKRRVNSGSPTATGPDYRSRTQTSVDIGAPIPMSLDMDCANAGETDRRSVSPTQRRQSSNKAVSEDDSKTDQWSVLEEVKVASTFHKFALDVVKMTGLKPEIISEAEHNQLVRLELRRAIERTRRRFSPADYHDLLKLTNSFIARAGQKFCGEDGLFRLKDEVEMYVSRHVDEPNYRKSILIHQLALMTYLGYLDALRLPKIDFNLLMQRAIEILESAGNGKIFPEIRQKFINLKYLMVDEYQDFSYLFYAIIRATRTICKDARLFAVGDDWQAINRFAGSDVDYFLNFEQYFPEDCQNIPLLTNYRSDKAIVENANDYMLKNYNAKAKRAKAFSKKNGKIHRQKLEKVKFDMTDILEDGLGDGYYQKILIDEARHAGKKAELGAKPAKTVLPAAKMLKSCVKIIRQNRKSSIMLLHRHNFTSVAGVDLIVFERALKRILVHERLLNEDSFAKQIRMMTMHKSKGLESDVVILLELDQAQVLASHPFATMFEIFDDNLETEKSDQHRLIYVALTRAKHKLYILTSDQEYLA